MPRVLTSSFGEYRPGRFHAGIDLRTGGIGIPVYAAADGHVSRVRCSPHGYGKAVYLQFADGNSAVYGHLDDFPSAIRAYVRAKQHEAQDYTVDLHPEPGVFPIKKGDLVAYSGQTGIGAPHLHYELRNQDGIPINPRLLDVVWPDTAAPVIKRIAIVPADASSLVEGGQVPLLRTVARDASGRYHCNPVRARGRIGLGAEVTDPAEAYTLGIHTLEAKADGKRLFTVRHDLINYDTSKAGAVAYHPTLKHEGRFLLAYRWPGNNSESYGGNATDGWLPVGETPLEVTLSATDFLGNAIEVTVPIEPLDVAEPQAPVQQAATKGEEDWTYWGSHITVDLTFDGAEMESPQAILHEDGRMRKVAFRRISDSSFSLAYAPTETGQVAFEFEHPRVKSEPRTVAFKLAGGGGTEMNLDGLHFSITGGAPYGMLALSVSGRDDGGFSVWPPAPPTAEPITIRMPFSGTGEYGPAWSIYRSTGGGWSRVSTTPAADGGYDVQTSSFGTFAWKQDTTPPMIAKVSIPVDYTAESLRPNIEAQIKDDLSGIESFELRLGEKWLLAAWDPERERLFWERDEDLPVGTHTLTLKVVDAAGNEKTVERKLTIPQGAKPAKAERL